MGKGMHFPEYRKLGNDRAYYKIVDERNFIEIQVLGRKIIKYEFTAEKYPEILRIQDMLNCDQGFEMSSESEFNHRLSGQ